MSSGAIVLVRFYVSNLLEHEDPDWDLLARAVIEEEGIAGVADDSQGEIVSIEKWDGTEAQGGE